MIPPPYAALALIGFMGAGKTTVGRALGARLAAPFVDTDEEVERRAGRPVAAVFAEGGEPAFRRLEEEVVAEALDRGGVVALGGGAVLSEATRRRLRERALTVWLDVPADVAWERVAGEAGTRPLARDRDAFGRLLDARRPVYAAAADAMVDGRAVHGDEPLLVPVARPGALAEVARLAAGRPAALLADEHVLGLVGAPLAADVVVALPRGEAAKTPEVARGAWERLSQARFERGGVVVGLGGGAATDLAGFAAATYRRGVPWIAVPTTLLGMVDAAVGGKTAIDLPGAKNEVGAFHPPERIVADPDVLDSLPDAAWAAGFAEAVKTGLLAGGALWDLVRAWGPGRADAPSRLELVRRCAAAKAAVVARDPTEQGPREVLNLGHTIGHGVEIASGYRLVHGEAVAVGLAAALALSRRLAGLDAAVEEAALAALRVQGLPLAASGLAADDVLAAVARDKKRRRGRTRMVLLEAPGRPVHGVEVDEQLLAAAVASAVSAPG